MEVHAHTHTERKKFTHYLWEFLMLFLAVFCGFLAENQREHLVERQREKKYILSLIKDLRTDAASFEGYINVRLYKRKIMDSLTELLTSGQYRQHGSDVYFFARQVFIGRPFVSTDGTMQELKNAGNLRLIKNQTIIDSILSYDESIRTLRDQDNTEQNMRNGFREMGGAVFDAGAFYKSVDSAINFVRLPGNPRLITNDLVAINKIAFHIQYISVISMINSRYGIEIKAKAERLIALLKKEYHLK